MLGHTIKVSDVDYAMLQQAVALLREHGTQRLPRAVQEHLGVRPVTLGSLVGAGAVLLLAPMHLPTPEAP